MSNHFDIIVIGAGHAGIEAALAAARMGSKTMLLTMNNDRIGYMSCNPAIGGQAKGQLAREIDALGGEMGVNTDKSALQYKRLNSSKGPAVRSSRAQCDKVIYSLRMKETVEMQDNLTVTQAEVKGLSVVNNTIRGVFTSFGEEIRAAKVIITAGTFMRSIMHCGESKMEGGRAGDSSASAISASLLALGFPLVRLKTGTPARLQKKSINFSILEREGGDENPVPFSFYTRTNPFPLLQQLPCHLTYTNAKTHEIIAAAKDSSPMFTGQITGKGPRYCPSIEDKVFRFADKERHQIFLEPESQFSNEIYANGLSTSLPIDVQIQFLRTIPGLENVEIARPGYAVEYDAINSVSLRHTLESKDIAGLYFAGQVNGTSGYEEAGAQGLVAGINAALSVGGEDPFVMTRDQSYIAVLVDDLVTKGCDEPYRMFTSRCEYRLVIREDNADQRLAPLGRKLGLLDDEKYAVFDKKLSDINGLRNALRTQFVTPKTFSEKSEQFQALDISPVKDRISYYDLLKRAGISVSALRATGIQENCVISDAWNRQYIDEYIEIESRYEGYIVRELERIERMRGQDSKKIPLNFRYSAISGLSTEVVERLERVRPENLGQVLRIPGVTPAAAALVYVHLEKRV